MNSKKRETPPFALNLETNPILKTPNEGNNKKTEIFCLKMPSIKGFRK
ncbi:hypothetical protein J1TS3_13050 [Siminovitchia fordii]|uniref:Uncharacterized protein n=1 Tax=Siminovitchia fordii TaxID=254759 RepID=A0ABQ4K3G2_9BACI|nr:hypothetical protein J1TS3_13050 [Siminovitchia fordii]